MRRAVLLGVPLILGLLEIGHTALVPGENIFQTLAPIATWWTVLHIAQIPLFALLGLAAFLLVRDLDGRAARISRRAIAIFIVVYPAFDAAVGVSSGVLVHTLNTLAPEQQVPVEQGLQAIFWGAITVAGDPWISLLAGRMLGVGRDTDANSGGGTELYVVIGHAPRQLDRNITLAGRVVQGMELLSSLPRGPAPMGLYEKPEQRAPIKSIRVAADVPAAERSHLEVLRTNTPFFTTLIESRRNRLDEWYKVRVGHVDLCNAPIVVRPSAMR